MCVLIAAAAVTVTREGRSSHSLGQFPLRIHKSVYQSKQAHCSEHNYIYQRASAWSRQEALLISSELFSSNLNLQRIHGNHP
jgi:hypothetical protein